MNGKIKKYFAHRGYGFIEVDSLEDNIFFHISNYPRMLIPRNGQDIEFDLIETSKGKEAIEIQVSRGPEEVESETQEKVTTTNESFGDLDNLDGVGPKYKNLLYAAGITSIERLLLEEIKSLLNKMREVNNKNRITQRLPTIKNLEAWINLVKK